MKKFKRYRAFKYSYSVKNFYKRRFFSRKFVYKSGYKRLKFFKHYYKVYKRIPLLFKRYQRHWYLKLLTKNKFSVDRKSLYIFLHKNDKYRHLRFPYRRQIFKLKYLYPNYATYTRLFKTQIREQHNVRWLYKLTYNQLVKIFKKAVRYTKHTFEYLFFKYLEFRLDLCLYRINLVFSCKQARQWVKRGLFIINIKVVNWPKYQVNIGDIIMPIIALQLQH